MSEDKAYSKKTNNFKIYAMASRLTCLLVLATYCVQLSESEVVLYKDVDYTGDTTTIPLINCTNLTLQMLNTTSAVAVHNRCALLHDSLNCTGNTIQVSPRSPHLNYLIKLNFEDKIQSVGSCDDPCVPSIGQQFSQNETNMTFPIVPVTLYSEPDFRGKSWSLQVKGCISLTESFPDLVDLPKSIYIPYNSCVLAFWGSILDNDEACVVKRDYNFLELRARMPGLHDIWRWGSGLDLPNRIQAISPCVCKSVTGVTSEGLKNLPDSDEKYVILFSAPNFMAQYIKLSINFQGCMTLDSNEIYRGWDIIAQSMFVANGSCVLVYKERNCLDYWNFKFLASDLISYLSYYNLNHTFKSFRACNKTDFEIMIDRNSNNLLVYASISITCVGFILSLILIAILVCKKWYAKKASCFKEKLSEREITDFIDGLGLELDAIGGEYENITDIGNNDELAITKFSADLLAENQPYDYQFEIAGNLLYFDSKVLIGSGQYGNVFKGTLNVDDTVLPVAVKTTKTQSNAQNLRSLLKEVKIMLYVGKHSNIVTLLGCCTTNLHEGELLIVMELCSSGSLDGYLKDNRANFVNYVQKGQLRVPKELDALYSEANSQAGNSNIYVKSIPGLNYPVSEASATDTVFSIYQLIEWSIEIAEGMTYLSSKRVIHGDLSARNILLDANNVSKISDFGLSRKLYCYSQYQRHNDDPLPWRWLALESLKNLEFSTASDVWSYGILLWEIFTLGEQPYPGVSSLTNNFIHNLEQGLRPTIPPFSTSDCFNIISSCWDEELKRRPSFSSLASSLKEVKQCCEITTYSRIAAIKA